IHMKDGAKVQYAKFTAPGIAFEAADGSSTSPVKPDEGNVSLSLDVPDAQRGAKLVKSLAEGGTIAHEFGDVEWGGKFGVVHDRFGIEWYVSSP
ncbi:MAG TPA: VOC family protein, partial [Candidatus Cybelea sp.]|nr:VOC family protein [Candidatus Cybelea sp.]